MTTNKSKRYPLHQCRLYKIKSPAQLAEILQLPWSLVAALLGKESNYLRFVDKGRAIQAPKTITKVVHRRIAVLLSRVETPSYLHSAIKGRSYVTNANAHNAGEPTIKIDVRKFYPNVRAQAVFHFFLDIMQCSGDVAGILTKLLTVDGHLPTGGNASAILSFWAYRPMFDQIDELAHSKSSIFGLYVDDMTITGPGASRGLLHQVRKLIGAHRLCAHKSHRFERDQPRVITGVAVTKAGARVPKRRQKKIGIHLQQLVAAQSDAEKIAILNPLISRVFEAGQVDPSWLPRANALVAERRGIRRRIITKQLTRCAEMQYYSCAS